MCVWLNFLHRPYSQCPTGGLPTIRHNELRDFTAKAMSEVCHNVQVEPPLQPVTGETLTYATANTEDGACLDISVEGFWGNRYQRAFFDVRVFNPNAPSYRNLQSALVYRRQERQKQRAYEKRVRNVELGSFTPLIFLTSGGMSRLTSVAYKRLASMLSGKRDQPYSLVMAWLRCPSRCYDQPSPAFVGLDHLMDMLYVLRHLTSQSAKDRCPQLIKSISVPLFCYYI